MGSKLQRRHMATIPLHISDDGNAKKGKRGEGMPSFEESLWTLEYELLLCLCICGSDEKTAHSCPFSGESVAVATQR